MECGVQQGAVEPPKGLQTVMYSSTVSSLASPVDSGVQMMDSESELTSVMSNVSGCDLTLDGDFPKEKNIMEEGDHEIKLGKEELAEVEHKFTESDFVNRNVLIGPARAEQQKSVASDLDKANRVQSDHPIPSNLVATDRVSLAHSILADQAKSDLPTSSGPAKSDMPITTEADLMNVSLNTYELLDYTAHNVNVMHVSVSEEVNENLKVTLDGQDDGNKVVPPTNKDLAQHGGGQLSKANDEDEEQLPIVYRRHRQKKKGSGAKEETATKKKRVSFHEDILNSTRIDDVRVNLGFVTHEGEDPEIITSPFGFFRRGGKRRGAAEVVQGRYSWAAEGDTPYYETPFSRPHHNYPTRKTQSEIYQPKAFAPSPHQSSTSSSSTTSSSSSSSSNNSIDEEEEEVKEKKPRSSCLKKTKHDRKHLDTQIVLEEEGWAKKRGSGALLESGGSLFGSLKNILNLAERGVPEGQEDVVATIYSSSQDLSRRADSFSPPSTKISSSFGAFSFNGVTPVEFKAEEAAIAEVQPAANNKSNLKLGFPYRSHVHQLAQQPSNVVWCDTSAIYEHRGISYSYEFDCFRQIASAAEKKQKKASVASLFTSYSSKMIKELKFFNRRETKDDPDDDVEAKEEDFEIILPHSNNIVEQKEVIDKKNEHNKERKYSFPSPLRQKPAEGGAKASLAHSDWSDTETILSMSDQSDIRHSTPTSRHLESPRRRLVGNRANHYTVQSPLKVNDEASGDVKLPPPPELNIIKSAPSTSTLASSSLIGRFLRNVAAKKLMLKKEREEKKKKGNYLSLCPPITTRCSGLEAVNKEMEKTIKKELEEGRRKMEEKKIMEGKEEWGVRVDERKLQGKVTLAKEEKVLGYFPARTPYTSATGRTRPLHLILTTRALYIVGVKQTTIALSQLDSILIGPNGHVVHFYVIDSGHAPLKQYCVAIGCTRRTKDLIGRIEIAIRRSGGRGKLPAVKMLDMDDMRGLRGAVGKRTGVAEDEDYHYYGIVHVQDYVAGEDDEGRGAAPSSITTLLCRTGDKEGPLMFKLEDELGGRGGRWETAYFILKSNVLYMLTSSVTSSPITSPRRPAAPSQREFPLSGGRCRGAWRVPFSPRPHTFLLAVATCEDDEGASGGGLLLAAEDEYAVSDWLQALLRATASPITLNTTKKDIENNKMAAAIQACTLLVTSDRVLTVREAFSGIDENGVDFDRPIRNERGGANVLSCAAIGDLAALRLPWTTDQCWCVLEFSCREAQEDGGDLIVYFGSNGELENFISVMETLWHYQNDRGDSFPLATIPRSHPLTTNSEHAHRILLDERRAELATPPFA